MEESKQLPNEVTRAVSNIMKFLEKAERDFLDNRNRLALAAAGFGPKQEEEHEDS